MQFLKYAFIGALGTAAHYLVLILGVELGGGVLVFTSMGFVVGALINHHLNRRYTFDSNKSYLRTLLETSNVAFVMFLVNLVSMFVLTEVAKIDYRIAQVITTLITFFIGFLLNKYLVFRKIETR